MSRGQAEGGVPRSGAPASHPKPSQWLRPLGAIALSIGLGFASGALASATGVSPTYQLLASAIYLPLLISALVGGLRYAVVCAIVGSIVVLPGLTWTAGVVGLQGFLPWLLQGTAFVAFAYAADTLRPDHPWLLKQELPAHPAHVGASASLERVLESLAHTVEVRDQHSQGHCSRVAANALAIGRALAMTVDESNILYWAALLHDLGKIAVPEYILQKQARLTEDEFSEIRRHPAYGADLLASISSEFKPIADVVRSHHERWDGQGYPLGYRGQEIPLMARIIAIVDVFEALTSQRPYRQPMQPEHALEYIRSGTGSQFDPELVPLFSALFEQGELVFADNVQYRHELMQPAPGVLRFSN